MAVFDPNVDITIEAAFGNSPWDASPSWTDISTYVRRIETRRGRSNQLARFEAGYGSLLLDNDDQRFDPNNTSSPYSPNIKVNTPIKITATYSATPRVLFRGVVKAWPQQYQYAGKAAQIQVPIVDDFQTLARRIIDVKNYVEKRVEARMIEILDDVSWPNARRDIQNAVSLAQEMGIQHVTAVSVGDSTEGEFYLIVNDARSDVMQYNITVGGMQKILARLPTVTSTSITGTGTTADPWLITFTSPVGPYVVTGDKYTLDDTLTVSTNTEGVLPPEESVLSHLQRIVEQEAGQLFMSASGSLTYRPRTWFEGGVSPTVTFGPSAGERNYTNIEMGYDDKYLWNDARVTRQGGVTQRTTDATSISTYGQLTLTRATLHANDNEALNTAEWLVDLYSDIDPRVDRLTVRPRDESTAIWADLLLADINSVFNVELDPPGAGDTVDVDVIVQGVEHVIAPLYWETVFHTRTLASAETLVYWLMGSEQLGTGTRLA